MVVMAEQPMPNTPQTTIHTEWPLDTRSRRLC
jgi:hypothetical protein